jgi:16S rRNA (adenine1518-N6/adenine1519-N6)-dimethyltransferase
MRETSAKKSLGQHFLRDAQAIRTIAGAIPEGSKVLEIGPGPGAITEALLARAAHLTVIEKDDRYAAHWQARADARLAVVHGDVMQALPQAVAEARPDWIAGNLPYNISGPLTAMLAGMQLAGGMVLMYQREVGERLVAEAGGKTYGTLSVLVRHHYAPKRLLILPPGAFSPPPKVHSMVVVLTPHGQTPPCTFEALRTTVRHGFAHRRKTIANNFRGLLDADALTAIDIDPGIRPERLDYAAWTRLALAIQALPAALQG